MKHTCNLNLNSQPSISPCLSLSPQPNNEKALYRKSKVLQEKLRSDEAAGVLRRLTRLYPNNKGAAADLARLEAKQKKHKENESRYH